MPRRRVRWSPCGSLLASASEDHTLRLWAIPTSASSTAASATVGTATSTACGADTGSSSAARTAAASVQPQLLRVLVGHAGRLWDCCFGGGDESGGSSSSSFLVTASEDGTCRLWCLASGRVLATIAGHCGRRGIWNCVLLPPPPRRQPAQTTVPGAAGPAWTMAAAAAAAAAAGCHLFTGGADGSIKCWRLDEWLPPPAVLAGPLPPTVECFMLHGLPPQPAADCHCGSGRSYGWQHHHRQAQQQLAAEAASSEANGQAATTSGGVEPALPPPGDSRAEWVRCLALASAVPGTKSSFSFEEDHSSNRHPRLHWLYVGTNRGAVHRVTLPGRRTEAGWQQLNAAYLSRILWLNHGP